MVLSKLNPKKNSDLKKKIGTIGTISANMNRETILMIFLLQDCSEEVFDTRKVKILCFRSKDMDSSSFKHKIEQPNVLTANVLALGRPGLDFKDIRDVVEIIKKENDPIIALLRKDAEKRTTDADQAIYGPTLGDLLGFLEGKHQDNPEQLYLAARKVLIERKRVIIECLKEFEDVKLKGISSGDMFLKSKTLKSKHDGNLIQLIAQANGLDFIRQRNQNEVVIFSSVKAQKYMPGLLKKHLGHEPTGWTLAKENIIINPGKTHLTMISEGAFDIMLSETVREFDLVATGKTERKGNEMPVETTKHNIAPHHDTAMAHVQIPEHEVSASQVA